MKYLLLAYADEPGWTALPFGERERYQQSCRVSEEILRENGYLLNHEKLQDGKTALTLRVRNGQANISDILNAYAQNSLTNLFIVSATDLNEAIQVAAKLPHAQLGPIEIRSIA